MSSIYSTLGLVLRSQSYSESDLILSILSKEQGKFSAIAKNSKKKSSSQPEILDLALFEFKATNKSNDLAYLKSFKPQKSFLGLRQRLGSFICACAWIESVDLLTIEHHQESGDLFDLTISTLKELDSCLSEKDSLKSLTLNLQQALSLSGYGNETRKAPSLKNLQTLATHIEEISHRKTKSFGSVYELARKVGTNSP